MKTQTAPALTGKAAYQSMIAKASKEMVELGQQEQQARQSLQKAEQDQQVLAQRARARADQLQTAHSEVTSLQTAVEAKRASVAIAEGTGAHSELVEALQALEKRLQKAIQHLQSVQASSGKEEQADTTKRETIDATLQRETIALQRLAEKKASISDARDRARIALGQEEYAETMALVEVLQNHVAAKQAQLHQAEQELEQALRKSITRLAEYPELAANVKMLQVPCDASTQMLESFILFLDLLLSKGSSVQLDQDLVNAALGRFASLNQLLVIDERELWPAFGAPGDASGLRERKARAEKLLQAYREKVR